MPRFSHALLLMLALCGNVSAQQYKTTDGYKNINGTDIYYETVGRGEPILVVHGGPAMNHDTLEVVHGHDGCPPVGKWLVFQELLLAIGHCSLSNLSNRLFSLSIWKCATALLIAKIK